jgi:hypothetical protein
MNELEINKLFVEVKLVVFEPKETVSKIIYECKREKIYQKTNYFDIDSFD